MKIKLLPLVIMLTLVFAFLLFTFQSKDLVTITSDDEEWLVVAAYPDDQWFREIYGVSVKNPNNLVLDIASIGDEPEWSSDGQWIISSTRNRLGEERSVIYLEKSDGTQKIRITKGHSPTWSLDGDRIAYTFQKKIYVVNTQCFIKHGSCDIDPSFVVDGQYPAWSPDGDSIAFYYKDKIYAIKVDTSAIHEVFGPKNGGCIEPDWSSTNKILFACWGDYVGLYTIHGDGTNLERIDTGDLGWGGGKWSPSGGKIAFVDYLTISSVEGSTSVVYVMDADGSNPVRLTPNDNYSISWFTWMPPNTKPQACTIFCQ
jgi:Tol biopolymer transport system component